MFFSFQNMSLNIDQIAEAFCRHRFVVTYPYMADAVAGDAVNCPPGNLLSRLSGA
jgi:hypothetical protein